ncbi:MAG: murein transglycosylase, partial [Planctomycetes bacterium]|nr:murein transglycosylase [Planctomycetota bacterium]
LTHEDAAASLEAFAELLEQGLTGTQLNAAIRRKFDVYESVGCDNRGTVLFTGYYTPIFDGSMEETAKFKYPLYKLPKDLLKGPDGIIQGRRMPDGGITPYPPRKEIEATGMLKGSELLYLADPFEVYIAHVQGSAKIRLPDGELITVGYAASNGHEYKSVSRAMLDARVLNGDKMSLSAMIDYFKRNPGKVAGYIEQNPRFVFFQNAQSQPHGSINTPVTPMRTIATDKSVYPRACLAFVSTTLPRTSGASTVHRRYNAFALDQDTGGAIRAAGRCDIYMGVGDQAGKLAGQVYQEGKLYYLFLK